MYSARYGCGCILPSEEMPPDFCPQHGDYRTKLREPAATTPEPVEVAPETEVEEVDPEEVEEVEEREDTQPPEQEGQTNKFG
jgi:hypothetical protein